MDLSPGTVTVPASGGAFEKDNGMLMASVFDSGVLLWQGAAQLAGIVPPLSFLDSVERLFGSW
jgi:hypothetical protein